MSMSVISMKNPILPSKAEKLINECMFAFHDETMAHRDDIQGKKREIKQILTQSNQTFPPNET